MIKIYYTLTKPGIILGNVITATAGFMLASKGHINVWLLFAALLGLSFVIGSACVFNNYIDRASDEKMARTKNRALAKGLIPVQHAIVFASLLGILGLATLVFFVNLTAALIALSGLFVYIVVYSFLKYHSTHATLVGSIAGGLPPVVGYCAVTGRLDLQAAVLFLIIVLWQMPHFFAIAIYRFREYAAASIPVLPVKKGMHVTKVQMLLYTAAFTIAAPMPTLLGFAGYGYLGVSLLLGLLWLRLCIQGFKNTNDTQWARKMFLFSLVTVTALCIALSIDALR